MKYKCPVCGKVLEADSLYELVTEVIPRHVIQDHPELLTTCVICGRKYVHNTSLYNHLLRHSVNAPDDEKHKICFQLVAIAGRYRRGATVETCREYILADVVES